MEMKEIPAVLQGAAGDYVQKKASIMPFFDYPLTEDVYKKRARDLENRSYPRRELVAHLLQYNESVGAGAKTMEHIYALSHSDTYAVIGGQQAGLLGGPLYTIHKIISILHLAKEQERNLGTRVVPVFWIAGEDHDLDEINHVYVSKNGKIKKSVLTQAGVKRASASEMQLDQQVCLQWIEDIFKTYRETEYTSGLLQWMKDCLVRSETYVDFFAHMMTELFKEEGIILVDSNHPDLRKLEVPFLQMLLGQHSGIQAALSRQQQLLHEKGYTPIITTKQNAAHLFIHVNGERWLLEKDGERFTCMDGAISYTADELHRMIEETPHKFSNNVVTRPLMQEYVFPTLAFIGGPGEVAYWAELQQAFHHMRFTMPPVVPRLMLTYVERNIETDLHDVNVHISDIFHRSVGKMKESWLTEQTSEPIEEMFAAARSEMARIHMPLRELAVRIQPGLTAFSMKNKRKMEEQLHILEKEIQKHIHERHNVQLRKFDRVAHSLQPMGVMQERVWNVMYYLNEYGFDFISDVMKLSFSWDGTHKCVKL